MLATFSAAVIVASWLPRTCRTSSAIEFGRLHDRKTTLHLITPKQGLVRRRVVENAPVAGAPLVALSAIEQDQRHRHPRQRDDGSPRDARAIDAITFERPGLPDRDEHG